MLAKSFNVEVIPAVEGVEGRAASLVCIVPYPPSGDPAADPPAPPSDGGDDPGDLIYLYVPDNLVGPIITETRTAAYAPAPEGYVCTTAVFFINDPLTGPTPVLETRCYYDYEFLDD